MKMDQYHTRMPGAEERYNKVKQRIHILECEYRKVERDMAQCIARLPPEDSWAFFDHEPLRPSEYNSTCLFLPDAPSHKPLL